MARIQPVLSPTEIALVDQMAELTQSKRTDVIKNALTVYHWFVRQSLTGSHVIARKPIGEEVSLETAELAVLEGKGCRLGPDELGLLAKELATASNAAEAARVRERLTRGFYGV
jgi:hypothetical protein